MLDPSGGLGYCWPDRTMLFRTICTCRVGSLCTAAATTGPTLRVRSAATTAQGAPCTWTPASLAEINFSTSATSEGGFRSFCILQTVPTPTHGPPFLLPEDQGTLDLTLKVFPARLELALMVFSARLCAFPRPAFRARRQPAQAQRAR